MTGSEVKRGVYRHYKNKLYLVICEAKHTETEEVMVVYQALYGQREYFVRPKEMFMGYVEVGGKEVQRFSLIDEAEV